MDADDWKSLALNHLAPGLGCIIAFLMFVSPLRAVQNVRKLQSLGDLNPLPLVAIIANCMVWLIYGES
ncbi:bidirectional sugar transporter SWEET [Haematococcus lacustris]|uniref:Bidirectional sugar transporter SWEET n=1 Tax=Haematococcus lacustris TaxID=44745 RepID=A0A699YD98_HAELA|nr:bidirectional sugar transporter SWEET [Haematococcus lacustris]